MTQLPLLQIVVTAIGIDQRTGSTACHGVDRQIAPPQVLLEADIGGKFGREAAVARPGLAFKTRECVLLFSIWVQKHREFPPDRSIPQTLHFLRRRADHDPVVLDHGPASNSSRTAPPTR